MSRLLIEASTPLCLLQDAGRFGVRHLGVTQGGAADWLSMAWANWMLGNALGAAVVEITLGGFTVVAEEDCVLALAGADLGARIDGQGWRRGASSACAKVRCWRSPSPCSVPGPTWQLRAVSMRLRCWAVGRRWCVRNSVAWMGEGGR